MTHVLLCRCRTGQQWRSTETIASKDGLRADVVLAMSNLGKEIDRSLQCRNCETNCTRNPPRHEWDYMRVESPETSVPSPESPGELCVKFECAHCESIHIAVPLPAKGLVPDGIRWSKKDAAVQLVFESVHAWGNQKAVKPRATNRMAAEAHETRTPDSVERAANDVARARSVEHQGPVGGATGATGEDHGDGEESREGAQAARTAAAAVSRAAKGKARAKSPSNPRE